MQCYLVGGVRVVCLFIVYLLRFCVIYIGVGEGGRGEKGGGGKGGEVLRVGTRIPPTSV